MTATTKLICIAFLYLAISVILSALYLETHEDGWLEGHLRWTYLVWSFQGPLSALEYGWNGLAPVWQQVRAFLAGSLVILPLLSLPLWLRGRVAVGMCSLGVVLWVAIAASLFGTSDLEAHIDNLIALAAELR